MQLLRTRREEALWEAERVTYEAGDFLQLTMNRYNNILYHLCIFRTFRIFLEHLELVLELTEKNVTKIKDKKLGRFQTGTEASLHLSLQLVMQFLPKKNIAGCS